MRFVEASLGQRHQNAPVVHVGIDGTGDEQFVSYGAVYGLAPAWELLWDEWAKLLDEYDVDHIKMSHAMSWRGAFETKREEWGKQKERARDELLARAAKLVRDSKCKATGATLDFQAYPSKAHKAKKSAMFAWLLRRLLQRTGPDSVLALMCDDDQQVAIEHYDFLNTFKRRNQLLAHRVAGACFYDDIAVYQLQAADMAAYVKQRGDSHPLYTILFDPDESTQDDVDMLAFLQDITAPRGDAG
jgi:hypothetical protein